MTSWLNYLPLDLARIIAHYLIPLPAQLALDPFPGLLENFRAYWPAIEAYTDIVRPGLHPMSLIEFALGSRFPEGSKGNQGDIPVVDYFNILIRYGFGPQIIRALAQVKAWSRQNPEEVVFAEKGGTYTRKRIYAIVKARINQDWNSTHSDDLLIYLVEQGRFTLSSSIFHQERSAKLAHYYYEKQGLITPEHYASYYIQPLLEVAEDIPLNYFYSILTYRNKYHPQPNLAVLDRVNYQERAWPVMQANLLHFVLTMRGTEWEDFLVEFYRRCYINPTGCGRSQRLKRALRRWVFSSTTENSLRSLLLFNQPQTEKTKRRRY